MRRSSPSSGVANTLSLVRDAILRCSCGQMQSWKEALPFSHSLGLTLLGAGTVGALLLLRQLSPSSALAWILPPRRGLPEIDDPWRLQVPGLRNSGNNCFLNAILQALASSDAVLSFLAKYDRDNILSLFDGVEGRCFSFPLTEALLDLLIELSELDPEPHVANPRHVMLALEPYAKQFDLSLQQDAAEALNYLAHALQEERIALFESLRTHWESMSDASRLSKNGNQKQSSPLNSWKRWPLEGTMGSTLVCQECGFKFATQYESFHEVLLSPPQLSNGNIIIGGTLEACLEKYSAPECISDVSCSCCSHLLALRLLQSRGKLDKDVLQRIKQCTFDDDCSCEQLVMQLGGSWRKVYVKAIKQLRFGRCPEVLCCQVQRVVMSSFGELVKWTGHVSFPLTLNIQPFVMSSQVCFAKLSGPSRGSNVALHGIQSNLELNKLKTVSTDGSTSDDANMSGNEDLLSDTSSESTAGRSVEETVEQNKENSSSIHWDGCINGFEAMEMKRFGLDSAGYLPLHDDNDHRFFRFPELEDGIFGSRSCPKTLQWHNLFINSVCPLRTAMISAADQTEERQCDELDQDHLCNDKKWQYELVSVVVHHGSSKGGHYTVYRKAKVKGSDFPERVHQANSHHSEVRKCDDSKSNCVDLDAREENAPHDNVLWNSDEDALSKYVLSGLGSVPLNTLKNISAIAECRDNDTSHEEFIISGDMQTGRLNNNISCRSRQSLNSDNIQSNVKEDFCSDSLEEQEPKRLAEDNTVLWFQVSDSNVSLVTEEEVLMAQATLLFYQQLQ